MSDPPEHNIEWVLDRFSAEGITCAELEEVDGGSGDLPSVESTTTCDLDDGTVAVFSMGSADEVTGAVALLRSSFCWLSSEPLATLSQGTWLVVDERSFEGASDAVEAAADVLDSEPRRLECPEGASVDDLFSDLGLGFEPDVELVAPDEVVPEWQAFADLAINVAPGETFEWGDGLSLTITNLRLGEPLPIWITADVRIENSTSASLSWLPDLAFLCAGDSYHSQPRNLSYELDNPAIPAGSFVDIEMHLFPSSVDHEGDLEMCDAPAVIRVGYDSFWYDEALYDIAVDQALVDAIIAERNPS